MLSPRPYSGSQDLRLAQTLVQTRWHELGVRAGWHIGDLAWWIAHDQKLFEHASERICLWLEDGSGETLASSWIDGHGVLDVQVLPSIDEAGMMPAALRWYEERVARVVPPDRFRGRPGAYAMDGDHKLASVLGDNGYAPAADGGGPVLSRLLTDGGPESRELPSGYEVRPVRMDAELATRVEVHRAAFHPSQLTTEAYRRVVSTWPYRSDLDWVAVGPDDGFVAFCLCWFDEINRVVTLEPVGCHPDHRGRGIAGAVSSAALRHAANLGALAATVCSDPADGPAWALYTSLGFHPSVERLLFEKAL